MIFGPGGAVAINIIAVDIVMGYYDIDHDDRLDIHHDVQSIADIVLSEQYRKSKLKVKK